jgi:hypothetical protein
MRGRICAVPGDESQTVIASEAKQSIAQQTESWIASLSLSSGGALRRPVGSQ